MSSRVGTVIQALLFTRKNVMGLLLKRPKATFLVSMLKISKKQHSNAQSSLRRKGEQDQALSGLAQTRSSHAAFTTNQIRIQESSPKRPDLRWIVKHHFHLAISIRHVSINSLVNVIRLVPPSSKTLAKRHSESRLTRRERND